MEDSELFLFIHYQGWKKKYDEWIAADKVLVDTPANRFVVVIIPLLQIILRIRQYYYHCLI